MQKKDKSINPNSKAIELLAVGLDLLEGKKGERGEKGEKGEKGDTGADSTVPGPKGEKGDVGPKGADGKDGKSGKDGKDGKDGKQGPKGDKGDTGPAGRDGKDALPVTPEVILDVTTPIIIQNVQRAVASKTVSASEVDGLAQFVIDNAPGSTTTWSYYATTWSVEPTLNTTITGGTVYDYTLDGTTRYRFVPTVYDATEDAFYTTFGGGLLTGLIVSRG